MHFRVICKGCLMSHPVTLTMHDGSSTPHLPTKQHSNYAYEWT